MTNNGLSREETALFECVPSDGSIGNKALRELLHWESEDYFDVRNQLIDRGILVQGRGKGGSVARVSYQDPETFVIAESTEEAEKQVAEELTSVLQRERSLYEPMRQGLDGWLKWDRRMDNFLVECTAGQGARKTGGRWSRPDYTVVAVKAYEILPAKYLDVITLEVKPSGMWDIAGVYEAAAHSRAATASFLAIHAPNGEDHQNEDYL